MSEFLSEHQTLLFWLGGTSVVCFFGTLIVLPWLIIRIPADYFTEKHRQPVPWTAKYPLLDSLWRVLKNLLGIFFLLLGFILLFMPGQGLLTMAVGVMLLNFPAKYRLERRLVQRKGVLSTMNWIRRRAGRLPLEPPGTQEE